MGVGVSVVVPTYKRPELLRRCLDALAGQDFDPAEFEIIVVDDAGHPGTRRLVEDLQVRRNGAGPALRYIYVAGAHGPAAARNAGWRAARAPIIAFTDDDCIPAPSWLRAGAGAFVDGVVGASGSVHIPLPAQPTDYELNASQLAGSEFVTANVFYRRDALAAIGGFDERFRVAWREDSDVFFTLLERGSRLVHAPDAAVVHPVRPAGWGVSLRQQRKSQFNALLYKKHPRLYRERVQPAPPWTYYATLAALLLAGTGAVRRAWLPAAGGVALWGILTGSFAWRRLRRTSRRPRHLAEMIVTSALIPPLSIYWRIRGAIAYRVWFL